MPNVFHPRPAGLPVLQRIDYRRFTHRVFARIGIFSLFGMASAAYAAPWIYLVATDAVPPQPPPADITWALVGALTATLTVAGNVILLIRDIARRKAKRAAVAPHEHPEILRQVQELQTAVESVVSRISDLERTAARDRQNLHRKIEHVGHEVESLRADMAAGQASQIAKIDSLTAQFRAERGDNEIRSRETNEVLGNIARALGLAAKAGLDKQAVVATGQTAASVDDLKEKERKD